MPVPEGAPAGPRGATGAAGERAVAAYLRRCGWIVLGRNLRIGRDEIDILALEPMVAVVVVEVRARTRPGYGAPVESVDGRKVARLYRAAWTLRGSDHPVLEVVRPNGVEWRVDLVTVLRDRCGRWLVERHLQGLQPP